MCLYCSNEIISEPEVEESVLYDENAEIVYDETQEDFENGEYYDEATCEGEVNEEESYKGIKAGGYEDLAINGRVAPARPPPAVPPPRPRPALPA